MTTVLKHSNPGPAHVDTARLLGQAWGRTVSFGQGSDALDWGDSGWLDSPSVVEPQAEDHAAWILWRTFFWEQTLPKDEHLRPMGRSAKRSLALPEAELRARELGRMLGIEMLELLRPDPIVVVDIDHLFAYRGRGWISFMGGLLRDLFMGAWNAVRERLMGPDPFFSMSYWVGLQKRHPNLGFQFFALLSSRRGQYDRGVEAKHEVVKEALRQLQMRFEVASHLSYGSHDRPGGFREELAALEHILSRPVIRQRFHFLRNAGQQEAAKTLSDLGLTEDWSLEFADAPGFRAGWASSVPLDDGYSLVPVSAMDQNFIGRSPREIADNLHELQAAAWSVGAPLRVGTHWRIFGPRPEAERNAKSFENWRLGLELWLAEYATQCATQRAPQ
jgi:hypothetical protein